MSFPTFAITRFKNRNGTASWRITGWLHGIRIRKNLKSREAAAAEKAALELRSMQAASGLHTVTSSLNLAQIREAEAVFHRLTSQPHSLSFCVDYTLANFRAPLRQQPLAQAIADYTAFKQREHERGIISAVQVRSIRKELALLRGFFPPAVVSELTVRQLTDFCERGMPSLKSYNNRRGILSTFFKFAFQQDWITANPIEKIPYHRIAHRRGTAVTLTAAQCRELMAFVEQHEGGRLVPFFALCLFAGIRPCVRNGEIMKLKPEHVRLDTGIIHVEPEISKVRMKRHVTIQPNLAAWLRAYPLEKFPIAPPNLQHLRAAVAKRFNLSADVMRHTFISMFVAKFRSMGEAALQAGNSETIIRRHYLDLKTAAEAGEFWSIQPRLGTEAGAVPFPAATAPALSKAE